MLDEELGKIDGREGERGRGGKRLQVDGSNDVRFYVSDADVTGPFAECGIDLFFLPQKALLRPTNKECTLRSVVVVDIFVR